MSHTKSVETLSLGQKLADRCASIIGSWKFITIQSGFLTFWILLNLQNGLWIFVYCDSDQ